VTGIAVEDILAHYPSMQRSRVFCKGGRTQTYELGAYDGERHVVVYDKRAELAKWNKKHSIKKPLPASPVARIEIVLRPSMPFASLPELP